MNLKINFRLIAPYSILYMWVLQPVSELESRAPDPWSAMSSSTQSYRNMTTNEHNGSHHVGLPYDQSWWPRCPEPPHSSCCPTSPSQIQCIVCVDPAEGWGRWSSLARCVWSRPASGSSGEHIQCCRNHSRTPEAPRNRRWMWSSEGGSGGSGLALALQ